MNRLLIQGELFVVQGLFNRGILRVEENAVGFRCTLALSAVSSFVRV